jgi:hypothetical protein
LWENKYKKRYTKKCDNFLTQLYFIIFHEECPKLTGHARNLIICIGSCYIQEDLTYINIFGATTTPHLFPRYVLDRLVVGKIAYQTILQGFDASLLKEVNNFFSYRMVIDLDITSSRI